MTKTVLGYFANDNLGREWRVTLQGEYESYPDGNNIVSELRPVEYFLTDGNGTRESFNFPESEVPQEILDFVEALLDDKDTYLEVQANYEKGQK